MVFFQRVCLASAALMLAGCNAAVWGNFVVFGVALGVFCGTLSLGDHAGSRSSNQSAAESDSDSV